MKRIIIFTNLIIIVLVISFFSYIFIKNLAQIKDIFLRPSLPDDNKELIQIIKDLDKNLNDYFNFSNSPN